MRKVLSFIAILYLLLAFAAPTWAACTTTTYFLPGGRIVICWTCCYGGSCTVNCF